VNSIARAVSGPGAIKTFVLRRIVDTDDFLEGLGLP